MAAPHQNEGPQLAPSRQRLNKSADGSGAIGDTTKLGTGAEPEGNTRIPNRCRGGQLIQLTEGFERREAKVKIFLRRKTNEDQGGVGLPLVGNQATGKTSQNWSFSLDTGRPSHGRRGEN